MAGLPRPGESYALLIGVERFRDQDNYLPLASCRRSAGRLYQLLTDQDGNMWRLPPERVRFIPEADDAVSADDARVALEEAADQEDVRSLLVCISTHGRRFDPDLGPPGLHLAMSTSRFDIPGTHWHFDEIARVLKLAARRMEHILLIIDACFSHSLAMGSGRAATSGASAESFGLIDPRITLLAATRDSREAWPHWPRLGPDGGRQQETGHTAFLGALIDTIEEGVPDMPEMLLDKHVFSDAKRRIMETRRIERMIPVPYMKTQGAVDIPLCMNNLFEPAEPAAGAELSRRGRLLTAEECFNATQALDDMRRQGQQEQEQFIRLTNLVAEFCESEDVPVERVAELLEKLEQNGVGGGSETVYDRFCTARSPAEIALLAHKLHGIGQRDGISLRMDERLVVESLGRRRRGGLVARAVYLSMLGTRCDCGQSAETMADLIVGSDALPGAIAVVRDDAVPDDTLPDDTLPDDTLPDDTLPDDDANGHTR